MFTVELTVVSFITFSRIIHKADFFFFKFVLKFLIYLYKDENFKEFGLVDYSYLTQILLQQIYKSYQMLLFNLLGNLYCYYVFNKKFHLNFL